MPGLILHTSNRLEILAEQLAQVVSTPLASPMQPEIILVQSKGMERWVSMELARHNGICANCRFPFPNHFAHRVFREFIPDLEETSPFSPEIMTWKIMEALPRLVNMKGFENLRSYLSGESAELKRFQLSQRIAELYDQYLLFRPEMILDWDKGRDPSQLEFRWQAVLWREIAKNHIRNHRAALKKMLFERIKRPGVKLDTFPERISVFGISALPPYHVEILAAVSQIIQVHLFLMNPCREYWGDLLTRHEKRRIQERERKKKVREEDLHLEPGNALLTSMGMLGRDFFELIENCEVEQHDHFEEPVRESLISLIQDDILNLRDCSAADNEKRLLAEDDDSIRIHSCHSPMREVEVLQDRLLAMFESDPALLPKDILIMTPDIGTYAPFIQAVFSVPVDDPRYIPFSIADRGVRQESQLADTFLCLLEFHGSRFGASQVMALLDSPSLIRRFSLSERDLDLIHQWVRETRICWGIDGEGKQALELPPFTENTWRAGLQRMLLGYAMPGRGEIIFKEILSYDTIEGGDAAILGNFMDFCERLFVLAGELGTHRNLKEWRNFLTEVLDHFFLADDETERDITFIRRVLHDLGTRQDLSGFEEKISPGVIKSHLASLLEQEGFGHGFLTGDVTFCAMLPMRSIPFRAICLLGMDDDAYPRQTKPLGFDLIARDPKPGDRSRHKDDRYLFLEALLSVREKLHISYVGQSIQDNSIRPPSVLVSELLDYIAEGFIPAAPEKSILEHIVTKHHLQAFNPKYFGGQEHCTSYSTENCEAARHLLDGNKEEKPFIAQALPESSGEWVTVDINQMCRFLANPARFLLNGRLGIHLEEDDALFDETEPFEVQGLEKYGLEQELVERMFHKGGLKDYFPAIRASGQLPHGVPGELYFRETCRGVASFVKRLAAHRKGNPLDPLEANLHIEGLRLTGRIENLYGNGLLQFRYADVKPKDRLKIWVHHLVMNSLQAKNYPLHSILACRDGDFKYDPVSESGNILAALLLIYHRGLTEPIHFFPRSSFAYAEALYRKKKDPGDALGAARKEWEGSDFGGMAESRDPYFLLCFKHTDPLDETFEELAKKIFQPLMEREVRIR
jgi:exodeoxyribonuclease V gamma subunit